jgi:hypothetical protein
MWRGERDIFSQSDVTSEISAMTILPAMLLQFRIDDGLFNQGRLIHFLCGRREDVLS